MTFKKIIDFYINKQKRKTNLDVIKHKLKIIEMILRTGISWKCLNSLNLRYKESNYRKFYYKLVKLKVIESIFNKLPKMTDVCFIDSSNVRNKHGTTESIGFCPQDKKHKGNKISLAISEEGKVIGCSIDKASCHDLKMFKETIKNVKCKTIVGDKGYTSKKLKDELKEEHNVTLLYPYKRNSKSVNNEEEKKLLKRRHKVENAFCNLKKLKRIDSRYERKLEYYFNFVLLGCLLML